MLCAATSGTSDAVVGGRGHTGSELHLNLVVCRGVRRKGRGHTGSELHLNLVVVRVACVCVCGLFRGLGRERRASST